MMEEEDKETSPMIPLQDRNHDDVVIPIDVQGDKREHDETRLDQSETSNRPHKEKTREQNEDEEKALLNIHIEVDDDKRSLDGGKMHVDQRNNKIKKNKNTQPQKPHKASRKTKMHLAAEVGNTESLKKLIAKNPNYLHSQDESCRTPLHLAALGLHYDCCRKLLEASTKGINMRDSTGNSPLLLSISSDEKSFKISELIISKGARTNLENNKKWTAAHIAAEKGNDKILKILLQKDRSLLERANEEYQTPLHLAASCDSSQALNVLLLEQANIEAKDKVKRTPLHIAAWKGSFECMKRLINKSCEINCIDEEENTPLHLTCLSKFDRVECVEELLVHGANINVQNNEGKTPFHLAQYFSVEVRKKLESKSPNLQLTDKKGRTVLHYAAKRSKTGGRIDSLVTMAKLMLPNLKDFVNIKDKKGITALYSAVINGNIDRCTPLLKAGADGNIICTDLGTVLHLAAQNGSKDLCKLLIDHRVKTNVKNNQHQTPLHLAAQKGHINCCIFLIEKGALLDETDDNGNTALHYAVQERHLECCNYLVETYSDLLEEPSDAEHKKSKPKDKKAKLIMNSNLLNTHNKLGKTPLHIAVENQSLECCKSLVTKKTDLWARNDNASPMKAAQNLVTKDIFLYFLQYCSLQRENQSEEDIDFRSLMKYSLQNDEEETVEGIIRSCYWEESLQPYDENNETTIKFKRNENLKTLIEKYPRLAKEVLDKCLPQDADGSGGYTSNRYKLFYMDEMLITSDDNHNVMTNKTKSLLGTFFDKKSGKLQKRAKPVPMDRSWRQDHALSSIINEQQFQLLAHPLIHMWIKQKWSYIKWIHYIIMLLSFAVSILLTAFSIEAWSWQSLNARWPLNQSLICSTDKQLIGPEVFPYLKELAMNAIAISYAIYALLGVWFLHKVYKMIKLRLGYFKQETYAYIITTVTSIIFVTNFTTCSQMTHIREDWQWIAGYIAIFSSWILTYYLFCNHPTRSPHLDFSRFFEVAAKALTPELPVMLVVIAIYAMIPAGSTALKHLLYTIQDMYGNLPSLIALMFIIIAIIVLISIYRLKREALDSKLIEQSSASSINMILDYEFLYPCLRTRFYRAWITTQRQEGSGCLSYLKACHPKVYSGESKCSQIKGYETNDRIEEIIKMLKSMKADLDELKQGTVRETTEKSGALPK